MKLMLCSLAFTPSFVFAEEAVSVEDKDFQKELLTIEEKVTALKKNVFSAKATLNLLRELVVQGNVSGSKANIWQINQRNGGYVIKSALVCVGWYPDLQHQRCFRRLGLQEWVDGLWWRNGCRWPHFDSRAVSSGSGRGLFSYVDDYVFTVRSVLFSSEEGENCVIRSVIEKRSAFSYSYEQRPNIVFQTICSEFGEWYPMLKWLSLNPKVRPLTRICVVSALFFHRRLLQSPMVGSRRLLLRSSEGDRGRHQSNTFELRGSRQSIGPSGCWRAV